MQFRGKRWREEAVNDACAVICAKAVRPVGAPVITPIFRRGGRIYLPICR